MNNPTLHVVVGSTRPGRVGPQVAAWFADVARADRRFAVEMVDLAEVDLPIYDEPEHPSVGRYTHDHTRQWSELVGRADAVAFVIPEYNHSFNAATKNAIDFLHSEWRHKPIGFVSYGGVAAGTRAVQALKPVFLSVKAIPVLESVNIPAIGTHVSEGRFIAPPGLSTAAESMLDELNRLCLTMRLRRQQPRL